MAKRKQLTARAFSAYTGEPLEVLRERIGEEEYARRVQLCQDRAMATLGLYREGSEIVPLGLDIEPDAYKSTAAQ